MFQSIITNIGFSMSNDLNHSNLHTIESLNQVFWKKSLEKLPET